MIRVGSSEDHGLALDVIQTNGGTQSRASLNDQVVNEYAEAIKAGATFPPIVVFYDGKKHWLADGFHRFHAYQKAGKAKVAADIRQGTRRDAILHSVGANETHGLRRTRDDKRRAVLTLLNDPEWSKWSDREIARRCAVGADMVGRLRPADTVAERQYVHPKTGSVTTMQTAGINAGRAQFQAKASEDNGSITGGAGAVTGEASRLASGRTDAGEAASSDLPTNSDADARTDAERDAYVIQWEWDRASDEGRALFLARNNLTEQPKVGAHDAEACTLNSDAVDPASIVTDGRAKMEPHDVDRSAERASSAVEVGAPVSPEGANEAGGFNSRSLTEIVVKSQVQVLPGTPIQGAKGGLTGMGRSDGGERPATNSPSAANPAEPEATPNPPPASGNPFPDPHSQRLTTGGLHTSSDDAGAKSNGLHSVVGQGGGEPGIHHSQSEQQDASATQARNKPGSVSGATVTNFAAMSKADQVRLLRPDCQHPDDLEKCGGSGRTHCHACKKAAAEGEAA